MEVNEPAPKLYKPYMTPEEYLEFERSAEEKHEYIQGEVLAMERAYEGPYGMAGARLRHVRIVSKLHGRIFQQLEGRGCDVLTNDMRTSVKPADSYFYPDLIIVCGKAEVEDKKADVLLNPNIIIEVLSKGTKDYDLGRKQFIYMQNPSVSEMAFVDSNMMNVKVSRRQTDNAWKFEELRNPNDILQFYSVDIKFTIEDIYQGIELLSKK
ncbi:MAG TPA: Uma2 family endonuclease [Chitinophagaceae bacterium]|jgi:Uma2 family endonuclease